MARYTIQAPDGRKITIEAGDEATAVRGAQEWAEANPVTPGAPANPSQGFQDATANASAMGLKGKVADLPSRQDKRSVVDKLVDATGATVNGLVNGVPVLGPMAQNLTDAIGGTVAQIGTGDFGPVLTPDKHANSTAYGDYVGGQQDTRAGYASRAPLASLSGNLVSGIASYNAISSIPGMAVALGMEAAPGLTGARALLGQTGKAAASNQLIGTVDSMARGDRPLDAFANNLVGSAVAGGIPLASAGARAAGRFANDRVVRPLAALANRENEVTTRLAGAINQDTAAGARLAAGQEAVANRAGAPVLNADRFGSAIRTLARTSSNVSPEADNIFRQVTEQRFLTQGGRAVNFLRTLMGGATDDIALQERLRNAARETNGTAYRAAYQAPQARAIWTPEIRQLMQATPFRTAINAAEETGANFAAVNGGRAVRNPFTFGADGSVTLRTMPDGTRALPNLEFWDIVQRNLRAQADQAAQSGNRLLSSQIGQMRTQLLDSLDTAVPSFRNARRGAAGFFGAEDAIDAGRAAVNSPKNTPEIERAVAAMSAAERDAFAVGFTSEIIDSISATRDRVNVINNIFGSQSARDRIRIALGPQRARELEAYVRVEQTLDMLRTATQGNSTTAKQLIAAGLMGGGAGGLGYLASGGDLSTGFSAATLAVLGRRGLQMLGRSVDERVMQRIAEVLASGDPRQLERAIQNASLSQAHLDAISAIMTGLQATARGVAGGASASAATAPVDLGVIAGGNPALAGTGY